MASRIPNSSTQFEYFVNKSNFDMKPKYFQKKFFDSLFNFSVEKRVFRNNLKIAQVTEE